MAILQQRDDIAQNAYSGLIESQKLLNNKDLLLKNFKEVIENLDDCEAYIQNVLVSITLRFCAKLKR